MKIINFGSLNIDQIHQVDSFVQPGQTIFANSFDIFPGGKGLNQSIAAARAGAEVLHAGCIGADGQFLLDLLTQSGADTSCIRKLDAPTGHAFIEINKDGQNRIIVYGGANQMLTEAYIDEVLEHSEPGDLVLVQNETNLIAEIMTAAHKKNLKIAMNPSPMPAHPEMLPLDLVDYFLVNEIEAAQLAGLTGQEDFETILTSLEQKFPHAAVVMTLGHRGVRFSQNGNRLSHPIFKVDAKDTTAAGDTFSGYFLRGICAGSDLDQALREASAASAIAVSRLGAACSIPTRMEVEQFLQNNDN